MGKQEIIYTKEEARYIREIAEEMRKFFARTEESYGPKKRKPIPSALPTAEAPDTGKKS